MSVFKCQSCEERIPQMRTRKEALSRVSRGCGRMANVLRAGAVLAALMLILSAVLTWSLTTRALEAGAPSVWAALYTSFEDGGQTGGGDLFTGAVSGSYQDGAGTMVEAKRGFIAMQCLAVGVPSSALMLVCLLYAARLLEWVQVSARPFDERVVWGLRSVARLVLAWGLLPGLTCWLAYLVRPDVPSSYTMSGGSLPLVIASVLIYGLVCIFEYGAELQRQDDELL